MMTYWDNVAQTRWGRYIIDLERPIIVRGQSMAGNPAVAVDLGCGSGRWAKLLSDLGWSMICADVDAKAVSICQANVPSAKCLLASPSGRTIQCESGAASLLLCIEVAPALEADWFPAELTRILSEKGIFIGVHVNRRSWRGLAVRLKYFLTNSRHRDIYYISAYPQWRRKIEAAGLEMLHEEGFCWFPFPRDSNSFLVPLFGKLERLLGLHRIVSLSPWIIFIARKRPLI